MPPHALSRSTAFAAVLILVIAGIFSPLLKNQFVDWDDRNEIFQNPDLNPVTARRLMWNWSHTRLSLYMPLTYITWGAIAAVAPRDDAGILRPWTFHALSIALHIVCSLLVFLLILQLLGRIWPAALGGLVFALHPLQAEAVAWASGMYTLLSTAFSLAALIAYVAYATRYKNRPLMFFTLATVFYAMALLTKAASVSVPVAAAVIDLLIVGRPIKSIVKSLSLWVLIGIPIVVIAKYFQDVSMLPAPSVWARSFIALDAVGFYLHKILLPVDLIPDYGCNPNWVMHHLSLAGVSIGIASIAILIAWFARRNTRWITAGVGLLVAGILPYLGLTTFDFQYVSTVADRYAYFGMVGVAVLIAASVARSRNAGIVVLFAAAIWAVLTYRQLERWRDTKTLFSYTLDVNPRSLVSHNIFGYLAARENRPDDAQAHYLAALEVWPQDATIQFNLGNLYLKDDPERAAERYALAVQYQPKFALYRNNLAVALARTDHAHQAYDQWKEAIADDSSYVDPHNNLGDMLMNLNRADEARGEYQAALQIDPNNAHARSALQKLNAR